MMNILIILGIQLFCLFIIFYNIFCIFNIYFKINSCVDKMLDEINGVADYIAYIMEFYYPSMYRNLNNLCFPSQVIDLKDTIVISIN